MKLYHSSPDDKGWNISRCHFDAEHSRVDLALARLKDLSEEFPNDAKILYAEGIIRRDFLGQGLAARDLFERAYHHDNSHWFAAQNATLLARNEEEFRQWVEIFKSIAPAEEPGRKFIDNVLDDLSNGMRYWQVLVYASQAQFQMEDFGSSAATKELALLIAEWSPFDEVIARRNRAQCLRALDKQAQLYRESIREAFNSVERLALHEAITELDKAIEIDEYDAELWNFKSAWCFFLKQYEKAIAFADRAIQLRPFGYAKPYINKAAVLREMGKNIEAIACAQEALAQAEKSKSDADIAQARRIIEDISTSKREASLRDLEEIIIRHVLNAAQITSDLEVGLLPSRSIDLLINGFARKALKIRSAQSLDYVPLLAELLSDFTPETAFSIVVKFSTYSLEAYEHCMNAALYVAAHSEGVQRRDASRFIALSILGALKADAIRLLYRKAILETSAAASDEMSHLDAIMREEFNRMNDWFSKLIADQEPVDEEGRRRAIRNIISKLTHKPSYHTPIPRQNVAGYMNHDMRALISQTMPPVTKGGVIFNIFMQVAPLIGMVLGWVIGEGFGSAVGFLTGMTIACIGWIYFFFIKPRPGTKCETCSRPVAKGIASPLAINTAGVMFSTNGLRSGREGPGDECVKCGRIFCTMCAQYETRCPCGSTRFRTVRLIYR